MKFSIRDLLWLTVVVALAVAWWVERRERRRVEMSLDSGSELSRLAIESLHDDIEQIDSDLKKRGLELVWSPDMRPTVQPIPMSTSDPLTTP